MSRGLPRGRSRREGHGAATARGIAPELLVSQVRNTAPYVFDAEGGGDPAIAAVVASPPARIVRSCADAPGVELSHASYFQLCLSAHYLTCATPVPTDVDNQIRKKLWAPGLPLATALEMAAFVLATHEWDFGPLTSRASTGARGTPLEGVPLHGHYGEWFTVAVGAYAALGAYRADEARKLRETLLEAIDRETTRHSEIFGSVWRAKDGLGALRASVSIAHDFGDLDRVIAMWDVPIADPLRLRFHGLTTSAFDPERALRYQGRLWAAGELYKTKIDGSSMALENHRHFALRRPRALRTHPTLRVPVAPFLEEWGAAVASRLDGEWLDEVVDALLFGQERETSALGYARGLHGIFRVRPELRVRALPLAKKHPRIARAIEEPSEATAQRWGPGALTHLDEIPSRA